MLKPFYTDDYNGAPIEDQNDVLEVKITDLKSGEVTVSHITKDTRDGLIQSDGDLESVFIHD